MRYTDDPVKDYGAYEEETHHGARPMCGMCGKEITDAHYYDIDGTNVCEECLIDWYRKDTEDYEG
jgi:uncharacterized CHY-type Zn-finger protein